MQDALKAQFDPREEVPGPEEKSGPQEVQCSLEANRQKCTCTYEPCPRKGKCCECLTYHWKHKELPGCLFPPEIERTYDRSLSRFIKAYSR